MKKITLISGANKGIGGEIAKKFASEGHNLILLVHNFSEKNSLIKKFKKKYKINIKYFVGDLKDHKFINQLEKKIPKVHNLINNAALRNDKHFLKVTDKDLNDLLEINLKSIFKLSQIFSKKMIKNKIKGCIISLSSQLGHLGAYNRSVYCTTKFGLEGLTKSMAMDLGKYGIRVNTVSPTKTIVNQEERYKKKKRLNLIRKKIPLKKFSTTKQIASIVYFLTTNSALSITGTSIISDGGWTAGK